MGLRVYKGITAGQRSKTLLDFSSLDKVAPLKSLLAPKGRSGGRGNTGRITVRHRGGGHKKKISNYRL